MAYENSAESSAYGLDDSFVREFFISDDEESNFEGFVNDMWSDIKFDTWWDFLE